MASDHVVDMRESIPPRDIRTLITTGQLEPPVKVLGEDDKANLAEAGTPFIVEEISYGDDETYGLYWQFRVRLGGGEATFRMGQHEGRDHFIEQVQAALEHGPISGLRLNGRKSKNGRFFLYLDVAE